MHIFKLHNLMSFDVCIQILTTIRLMNITISPQSFLLHLIPPSVPLSVLPPIPRQPLICFLSLELKLHFLEL